MGNWNDPKVAVWAQRGRHHELLGHDIFVVDIPPAGSELGEPLLVIHGFPTSSFDFASIADQLSSDRRLVLIDLLGYGLSSKPDIHYTMALQADVVAAAVEALSLKRFALLTHDMGDTVGGELLARHSEGVWPVEIVGRVVTNGSIYIDMANLTDGQKLLLSLPDELIADGIAPDVTALGRSLSATLASANAGIDMTAHGELIVHGGGNRLLARLIRYIEERRRNERRFTGAIESHPSPLTIVWGPEDPIAIAGMAEKLRSIRPDAELRWIDAAGHYPQIERADQFVAAVRAALQR